MLSICDAHARQTGVKQASNAATEIHRIHSAAQPAASGDAQMRARRALSRQAKNKFKRNATISNPQKQSAARNASVSLHSRFVCGGFRRFPTKLLAVSCSSRSLFARRQKRRHKQGAAGERHVRRVGRRVKVEKASAWTLLTPHRELSNNKKIDVKPVIGNRERTDERAPRPLGRRSSNR